MGHVDRCFKTTFSPVALIYWARATRVSERMSEMDLINLGAWWITGCNSRFYVDPGRGALLVQILAAAALSAVFFLNRAWKGIVQRLIGLIRGKRRMSQGKDDIQD